VPHCKKSIAATLHWGREAVIDGIWQVDSLSTNFQQKRKLAGKENLWADLRACLRDFHQDGVVLT
jgi:hypothetical protein